MNNCITNRQPSAYGFCFKCKSNRRFADGAQVVMKPGKGGEYKATQHLVAHTDGVCIICGTRMNRIGAGSTRDTSSVVPAAPKHDRPQILTRSKQRFIQSGCQRCGGAMLRDSYNDLRCINCSWEVPTEAPVPKAPERAAYADPWPHRVGSRREVALKAQEEWWERNSQEWAKAVENNEISAFAECFGVPRTTAYRKAQQQAS